MRGILTVYKVSSSCWTCLIWLMRCYCYANHCKIKKKEHHYLILWYSMYLYFYVIYWVNKWLLLDANSVINLVYLGENKLLFDEMMVGFGLCLTNTLDWTCIVLAHRNNSPRIDMWVNTDTLFWFRTNQSLLFSLMMHD